MKQPDRNLYFEWTFFDLILHFDSQMKMVPGVHCSIAPPLLRRAGEFSEDSAVSVFLPRHCFSFPSPDVALGRSAGRGRLDLKGKERREGRPSTVRTSPSPTLRCKFYCWKSNNFGCVAVYLLQCSKEITVSSNTRSCTSQSRNPTSWNIFAGFPNPERKSRGKSSSD